MTGVQTCALPICPLSTIHYLPDSDNIIPILELNYFEDDIVSRFKEFLRVSFGPEHFEENLHFIEEAIGRDIRSFFVKEFYKDHIKRYKKRPIYWLFRSPKGHFSALIYMHRYTPDLPSRLLNEYLRDFQTKLRARREFLKTVSANTTAAPRDRKAADKDISKIEAALKDAVDYEKLLYPFAAQKIDIDLDDGVKVNYNKFREVLAPVAGLTDR